MQKSHILGLMELVLKCEGKIWSKLNWPSLAKVVFNSDQPINACSVQNNTPSNIAYNRSQFARYCQKYHGSIICREDTNTKYGKYL